MRVLVGTFLVVVLVGGVGVAIAVSMRPSEESKLLSICDDMITERLLAPTTYKRISASPLKSAKADFNQFMGWDVPEKKQRDIEARVDPAVMKAQDSIKRQYSGVDWLRYSSWIEYDAANAYGTPIRSVSECVLIARSDEPLSISSLSDIRVDGSDSLDWSLNELWKASQ